MHRRFLCDRQCLGPARMRSATGLVAVALAALVSGCGAASSPEAAAPLPVRVSAAQLARLPMATTFGSSAAAPRDPDPFGPETGIVLHPTATRVIYLRPGGPPLAALPTTELGSPTWVPVVQSRSGWGQVLLPTRPNGSTGWIYLRGGGLVSAYSAYRIVVNLAEYRLTVFDAGRSLGSWTVAVGSPATPTPTGRTFLLASMAPVHPTYSPLILPLGMHSRTLSTFGGGPGTVGLHGWPDDVVFGHAVTHGCVRVPSAALRVLSRVPLGSFVMIVGKQSALTARRADSTGN